MKMNILRIQLYMTLLTAMILASTTSVSGQIKVSKVTSPESLTGKKGVIYTLPRTIVNVELNVIKSQSFPGPLAGFAREFLGLNDVITKQGSSYLIQDASVSTSTEPDPSQIYLIEKEEKSSGEIWVSFSKSGAFITMEKFTKDTKPTGFSSWDNNLYFAPQPDKIFKKYFDYATREVIDTVIRKISIDTLVIEEKLFKRSMVGLSDREKAMEASGKIKQINLDKYNLLVGYHETAYTKDALEFMYTKLEEERMEYLKLFTGVVVNESLTFTFEIIPDPSKEEQEYVIAGFSKSDGLETADAQNAIILDLHSGDLNPGPSEIDLSLTTGLIYRNPHISTAAIAFQGKEITNKKIEVLQFGPVYSLPPEFKRVEFDPETGLLKAVVIE